MSARNSLRELLGIRGDYGTGRGPEKAGLVRRLAGASFGSADEVERFHELLLFLRAYPDDALVLAAAEDALRSFADRRDVRRFRGALKDSGIAGTAMQYAFSGPMAFWLSVRDPAGTGIVWSDWEKSDELDTLLAVLAEPSELPGVDDETVSGEEWLANACAEGVSDYSTLMGRIASLDAAPAVREHIVNGLEVPVVRDLGDSADSRTLARGPAGAPGFQAGPIDRKRPDLRKSIREPIDVRPVDRATGERMADLARACMSVRIRELEAFDYADPDDSLLADAGRGLLITVMGMVPERRLMPEALYSGLFVKNGVPIGYWLASVLFGTAEVAYNIFPTFRGGEATWIYSRLLSLVHHFLGVTSFTVPRYQIGYENDEAIGSGAFWFYRKLRFQPIDAGVAKLLREEEARMRGNRRHRSSPAVLRRLTVENVVFHLGKPRDDLVGVFPYVNMGHTATRVLAERGEDGVRAAVVETFGTRDLGGFEPVVAAMKECRRWSPETRSSLVRALRAKRARSEIEYVHAVARHAPFRRALQRLCLNWEN